MTVFDQPISKVVTTISAEGLVHKSQHRFYRTFVAHFESPHAGLRSRRTKLPKTPSGFKNEPIMTKIRSFVYVVKIGFLRFEIPDSHTKLAERALKRKRGSGLRPLKTGGGEIQH